MEKAVEELKADLEQITKTTEKIKDSVQKLLPSPQLDDAAVKSNWNSNFPQALRDRHAQRLAVARNDEHQEVDKAKSAKTGIEDQPKKNLKLFGYLEEAQTQAPTRKIRRCSSTISIPRRGQTMALENEVFDSLKDRIAFAISSPHTTIRLVWTFVGAILIWMDATLGPVISAWVEFKLPLPYNIFTLIYWSLDILMCCIGGYYDNGVLITNKRKTLRNYATSWLAFDLIIVILDAYFISQELDPSIKADATLGVSGRLVRALRYGRIYRLVRLLKVESQTSFFSELLGIAGRQAMQLSLAVLKALAFVLYSIHWLACLWYSVGQMSRDYHENGDSWLTCAERDLLNESGFAQYIASFHWVIGQFTPAPMWLRPCTWQEQGFNIVVIVFGVMVMGTAISRVSQAIQQLLKSNADNNDKRKRVERYLKVNKTHSELSVRILQYVDNSLLKSKPLTLDISLLSETLVKELYMDRRGPLLMKHPLFQLIADVYPETFTQICGILKLTSYNSGDIIFMNGSVSPALHIVGPGTYSVLGVTGGGSVMDDEAGQQGADLRKARRSIASLPGFDFSFDGEAYNDDGSFHKTVSTCEFYSEASLFMDFTHSFSLTASSLVDVHALHATAAATCFKEFPASCHCIYEYARALVHEILEDNCELVDDIRHEVSLACCMKTESYRVFNLNDSELMRNFQIKGSTGPCSTADIQQLLDRAREGLSPAEVTMHIAATFPEVHPAHGSHDSFTSNAERNKAIACMTNLVWLLTDNYSSFTSQQPVGTQLSKERWNQLQAIIGWVGIREKPAWAHVMFVLLGIKGLGKSSKLISQVPDYYTHPDMAVVYLIQRFSNVVPSSTALGDGMQDMLCQILQMHHRFNVGQFIQAENSPVTLELFSQYLDKLNAANIYKENEGWDSYSAYRMFLLSAVTVMCGIGADKGGSKTWGSPFMNDKNSVSVILGVEALQNLAGASKIQCQEIYWSFVSNRGITFGLAGKTQADLAVLRLACLCRVDQKDLRFVASTWNQLEYQDRDSLIDFLLDDGLLDAPVTFSFLPACLSNALKNNSVGLRCMLLILIDLIEMVRLKKELTEFGELEVNLSDLANFIGAVKSPGVAAVCLDNARLDKNASGLILMMTSKNWSLIDSDAPSPSIDSMLKTLVRRQRRLHNGDNQMSPISAPQHTEQQVFTAGSEDPPPRQSEGKNSGPATTPNGNRGPEFGKYTGPTAKPNENEGQEFHAVLPGQPP